MVTVKSLKADVSSVSPSSERLYVNTFQTRQESSSKYDKICNKTRNKVLYCLTISVQQHVCLGIYFLFVAIGFLGCSIAALHKAIFSLIFDSLQLSRWTVMILNNIVRLISLRRGTIIGYRLKGGDWRSFWKMTWFSSGKGRKNGRRQDSISIPILIVFLDSVYPFKFLVMSI